ncbi:UNVERIFIED_CONTAM: hypothetical protein HDU68_006505 [Siphonaria sp. JEL0065]|nr:hypothetical protein HDU68_006505 [Siphonaria sp. JEL0065]
MGAAESKVSFRKGIHALTTGKTEENAPINSSFVETLLTLAESAEDVFNFVPPSDVRVMRDEQPAYFALLVETSVKVLEDPKADLIKTSNAVRMITRILPFVFEDDQLDDELFWGTEYLSLYLDI